MDYFVAQIDRDFTGHDFLDSGDRLYTDCKIYVMITGVSYNKDTGELIVKNEYGENIILNNEPNIQKFKNTLYRDWQVYHKKRYPTKADEDADSCDYEPWVYKDKRSIAISLNLLQSENNESLYIRNFQN